MIRLSTGYRALTAVVVLALGLATAAAVAASPTRSAAARPLVGTFKLTPGSYAAGKPTGSYFRMIYPGGSVSKGKFFANPDSPLPNKTYTPVKPGTDGGLVTGTYQPSPSSAFDAKGNARAKRITLPAPFAQIAFGLATLAKDPTTGKAWPAPSITVTGTKLSGQVSALYAEWNKLYFSQGSTAVSGTYDATTGAFTLTWSSKISGGPFNHFTGYWHLAGTVKTS
jgi:hypothetical protein